MKKYEVLLTEAALAEYVARHGAGSVTERINSVCAEVDTRPDPFVQAAACRILSRTEYAQAPVDDFLGRVWERR